MPGPDPDNSSARGALHAIGGLRVIGTAEEGGPRDWRRPPGGRRSSSRCSALLHLHHALCVAARCQQMCGTIMAVTATVLQETRRPDKYCDERVSIMQADARLLGPEFWQEHCPGGFDAVLSDM